MSERHTALIKRFYESFQRKDAEAMVACYADDVSFTDPVFLTLHGPQAGSMWRMLLGTSSDLRIEFRDVIADEKGGSAHWDAFYTFSATGKFVRNSIDARFEFRDGKIVKHVDDFDLTAWARQALGFTGLLFGGFGFLQNKVRKMARARLDAYMAGRTKS